ncbi:MAG: methyltransferase [Nanoarchaeota archaeon]|nr:methyltransferase [Nanoarchaeota archaeon]
MISEVYEPAEDSFLMVEALQEAINGHEKNNKDIKVLDMGAGSGYVGFAAKDMGCQVTFVDINQKAVDMIRERDKRATVFASDLFFRVPKKTHDIVVFNTPYLPNEEDGSIHDVALHGGPKGTDIALRFLKQINKYIDDDSTVLMLVSSLGDLKDLENFLTTHCFSFTIAAKKKLFHEELFIYNIRRLDNSTNLSKEALAILTAHIPEKYTGVQVYARGKRGIIFKAKLGDELVAIKVPLEGRESVAVLEGKHLKTANKLRIGPKLIEESSKYVAMEFVQGELIGEFLEQASDEEKEEIFEKILKQLELMDRIKFNKFELTNPYKHIIIKEGLEPILIDFERAKFTSRPKNVNQFKEYMKKFME